LKYKQFPSVKLWLLFLVVFSACAPLKKQTASTEEQKSAKTINRAQRPNSFEESLPLPAKGYFLKQLAKGLYFFSTGKNDTLFAVTSEGTLLVDPLKGAGESLQKAMIEVEAPPVKMMIYSYGDLGRIGSAYLFSDDVRVVAHRETAEFIRSFGDSNIPKPSISFGKSYSLELGGLRVDLKYPIREGGKGKVIIYFPDQKVLMYTNTATPKTAPPRTLKASNIFKRAKGLKEVLRYDFENYISGNYYRPGNKAEAKEILNYYYATKSANKKALQATIPKDKTENKSIVENCLRLLEPHWGKRLKGFKISAKEHCTSWTKFHLSKIPSKADRKSETKN
jgi:hypothetical protein